MSCKPKYGAMPAAQRRAQAAHGPYTKEELRAMLPKVGDVRMEQLACSNTCQATNLTDPQPCMVVEVNEAHLWYRVCFFNSGVYQCFKLPEVDYTGPRMEGLYR